MKYKTNKLQNTKKEDAGLSLKSPEHEEGEEEADPAQGVGDLRAEGPVEEGAEYRSYGPTQSSQGPEHSRHDPLLVVLPVLGHQAGQVNN